MDQAAVTRKVRARLQLLTIDMSDDDIESCTEDALSEFSNAITKNFFGTFPVYKGQDLYSYPPDIDVLDEVLFDQDILGSGDIFDRDLRIMLVGGSVQGFGGNVFENPTLLPIFFGKLKNFTAFFETSFEDLDTFSPRQIRLDPVPTANGNAYYSGHSTWASDEIPANRQETFLLAVLWKVSEARGNKLAVMKSISQSGGSQYQPAIEHWEKQAALYKEQFEGRSGTKGGGGVFIA